MTINDNGIGDWSKDVPLERCNLIKDLDQLPMDTTFAIGIVSQRKALCPAQTLTEANPRTYISTMTKTYGVDHQFWEDVTTHYDMTALSLGHDGQDISKDLAIKIFLDAIDTTIKESILTVHVRDYVRD